jgi:hypothetical protein
MTPTQRTMDELRKRGYDGAPIEFEEVETQ